MRYSQDQGVLSKCSDALHSVDNEPSPNGVTAQVGGEQAFRAGRMPLRE